ncbi:60Kd inner membrane protein-domain-containing protein, partial [Vararia minispora EC-137]
VPAPAPAPLAHTEPAAATIVEDLPVPDAGTAPADALPDGLVPGMPADAVSALSDAAHAAGWAPLHWGDLAQLGLTGWGPVGLSTSLLEAIQVGTGLPWFWTIVAGTLISRALCLPIVVRQQQNTAALGPHQPQLRKLMEELPKAQAKGDPLEVQKIMWRQQAIYREAGASLGQMLLLPFAQLPISLGMFFAIRRVMDAPIAGLHYSGIGHLIPIYADLTATDPYYILPLVSGALMNIMLSLMARDMLASSSRQTVGGMLLLFRFGSLISIPVFGNWTIGMNIHVLTGIVAMSAQMLVLRLPAVRRTLKIGPLPKVDEKAPSLGECIRLAQQWWAKKQLEAQNQAALRGPRRW